MAIGWESESPSMELRDAQRLIGAERFELRRELGCGSFGVVYDAFDRQSRETVALKLLRQDDPSALYRFKQEFRLLTQLVHPNLVTLFELLSKGDHWFFTMELIDGRSLLEHTHDRGAPIDVDRVPATFLALSRGLHKLHEAGLVHLDLKPPNVLVTQAGRVVLLDFGLAKPLAYAHAPSMASPEALAGSPLYMAPEQWWHLRLSPASDWYAVGVMLYETLTGLHPFSGSLQDMLSGQQRVHPPVRSLAPGAPADLVALCEGLLRFTPETRPSGEEVLRLLEGAARGAPPPAISGVAHEVPASGPRPQRLIGRERELRALNDALRKSLDGHVALVRVEGAAGMGKSALLSAFVDEQRRSDAATVLAGRCCERESVPYKALDCLIDDLCHAVLRLPRDEARELLPEPVIDLTRLFPVVRLLEEFVSRDAAPPSSPPPAQFSVHPRDLRSRAAGLLKELLRRLGRRGPLVLVIDDLQWGDVDSIRFLAEVLAPPRAPAMLLVLAYRSDETWGSPCLAELTRMFDPLPWTVEPAEIALGPLSPEDATRLIRERLNGRADAGQEAEIIARESGGNPLLIEEFVRYVGAGAERAPGAELSLDRVISARVAQLPAGARSLLEVVAVAGHPLEQILAFDAALPAQASLSSLALLRSAHLLRARAEAGRIDLEISHDRVRERLIAGIEAGALSGYHRRLAEVLEAMPEPPPDRLAVHMHGAGERGRAAYYAFRAAERAREALAFARAAELYGSALEWSQRSADPGLPPRRQLEQGRAEALALCGYSDEAAPLFLRLAETAPAPERMNLERLALEHYLLAGRIERGLALAGPILAKAGLRYPKSPREAVIHLLWQLVRLKVRSLEFPENAESEIPAPHLARIDTCWALGKALADVQPVHATAFQLRSLILALDAGEPARVARALIAFGGMWLWQGTERALATGTRYLTRGSAIASRLDQPELSSMSVIFQSARAVTVGDWNAAVALADDGIAQLGRYGREALWEGNMGRLMALLAVEATHRAREMRERGAEWHRVATERGDLFSQVTATVTSVLGLVAAGEPDEARRRLREAFASWPQTDSVQHLFAVPTEVYADLYEDRPDEAWRRIMAAWPRLRATQYLRALIGRMKFRTVRALAAIALAERDVPRRTALLREAEENAALLARELRRDATPTAHLLRAGVEWLRGDHARAMMLLALAETGFDAAEMNVHAACVRRRRGEIAGGDGGRMLVAEADARMTQQGVRDPARWASTITPGFG